MQDAQVTKSLHCYTHSKQCKPMVSLQNDFSIVNFFFQNLKNACIQESVLVDTSDLVGGIT